MSNSNIFLILNLGCEMLYVIDQRLQAQCVGLEKSTQVLRDITGVLLDPRFLTQLMAPITTEASLLTPQQCRILLTDIACCSLMRLDTTSMDKLWDLMTLLFKWQMSVAQSSNQIIDITFRHLDTVAKLLPEMRKTVLVDVAKASILDFWNTLTDLDRIEMRNRIIKWLRPFNVKISVLIRLGLQKPDGSFEDNLEDEHFRSFKRTLGDNIYTKNSEPEGPGQAHLPSNYDKENSTTATLTRVSNELESLVSQLNMNSRAEQEEFRSNALLLDDIRCFTDNSDRTIQNQFVQFKDSSSKVDQLLEKLNFSSDKSVVNENIDVTGQLLAMLDGEECIV